MRHVITMRNGPYAINNLDWKPICEWHIAWLVLLEQTWKRNVEQREWTMYSKHLEQSRLIQLGGPMWLVRKRILQKTNASWLWNSCDSQLLLRSDP